MTTVLLVVDVQEGFLTPGGAWKRPAPRASLIPALRVLVMAARQRGVPILWAEHVDGGALVDGLRESGERVLPHRGDQVPLDGVDRVVVAGLATDGAVRATVRALGQAAIVVVDALAAPTGQRHRDGLRALEAAGAELCSVGELASRWGTHRMGLGDGDSALLYGVLAMEERDEVLAGLRSEVDWQTMFHRGGPVPREVAIQGTVQEGREPVYRHPVDAQPPLTPFSPRVDRLRHAVEAAVGQSFNHVLIQRYPDRTANISLHADKTLDVARGSAIVNLSVGATRTLLLQHKQRNDDGRFPADRFELPHGSVFVLGWDTNRRFRHGIRPDRRSDAELRDDERVHGGERISLTFRNIATWVDATGTLTGQGARPPDAPPVEDDREALLAAFGQENLDPDFDWQQWYGGGFDRLNFVIRR